MSAEPELACSLEQRGHCHLVMVGGVPHLRLGQMCGLRRLFPGLRPPEADRELWLDTASNSIWYQGRQAILTRTEFTVVAAVAEAGGDYVTHQQIAASVWGEIGPQRVGVLIHAHLRNIRIKFRAAGIPDQVLHSGRGIGLRLSVNAGS